MVPHSFIRGLSAVRLKQGKMHEPLTDLVNELLTGYNDDRC